MAGPGGNPPITITTTPEQAREFLDRFTSSAAFRTRFQRDPQKVFEEYGIYVPSKLIPKKVVLPPAEEIKRLRAQLAAEAPIDDFSFIWALSFFSFIGIGALKADSFRGFGVRKGKRR